MLRHQLRDAIKYPGPGQHAEYGDQLPEVTGRPTPAGPNETASSLTTSRPAPILTSVDAAVHSEAFANDISGEVAQQRVNHRPLVHHRQIVKQRQAYQTLALLSGVAVFTAEFAELFACRAAVQGNVMEYREDLRLFQRAISLLRS